jgi:hypothetical protein
MFIKPARRADEGVGKLLPMNKQAKKHHRFRHAKELENDGYSCLPECANLVLPGLEEMILMDNLQEKNEDAKISCHHSSRVSE